MYLNGEAFFEVVKNPKKPFLVFTKDIVTKVLGTSFTVKAFDGDKEVKVMVKTGKVNVIQQKNLNIKDITEKSNIAGIALVANQQVNCADSHAVAGGHRRCYYLSLIKSTHITAAQQQHRAFGQIYLTVVNAATQTVFRRRDTDV